ncbi:MAG: hypothetical protein AAF806_19820 [Bacteroidota bacterium]
MNHSTFRFSDDRSLQLRSDNYGFRQYGRLLAVEQASSKALIDKYLTDEEE